MQEILRTMKGKWRRHFQFPSKSLVRWRFFLAQPDACGVLVTINIFSFSFFERKLYYISTGSQVYKGFWKKFLRSFDLYHFCFWRPTSVKVDSILLYIGMQLCVLCVPFALAFYQKACVCYVKAVNIKCIHIRYILARVFYASAEGPPSDTFYQLIIS